MRTIVSLLCLALCLELAAQERYPMLKPCGDKGQARCGTIEVPEDRAAKDSRKLPLNVVVFLAAAEKPQPDAIFALTGGGPGIASTPEAPSWVENYGALHQERDIVFWDERGTWKAGRLDCPLGSYALSAFFGGDMPVDEIAKCRDRLAERADLRKYTTVDNADDMEAIRDWLQIAKIDIYGASYTSRLALVYAQRYPKRVRAVAVKATTPIAAKNPLFVARDSQAALDRLFADCAADAKCAAAYPNLRTDFDAVLKALEEAPVKIGDSTLTKDVFAGVIRRMLYGVDTQAFIPLAIASAKRAEFAPLKPMLAGASRIDNILNLGVFLSTTCSEDVAHFTDADVQRETRGTFTGPVLASALKRACAVWPVGAPAHNYESIVKGVPAIVISGKLDPDTPPVWGREMSRLLAGSVHLEFEAQAHTGSPACIRSIVTAFIQSGSSSALPTDCLKEMKRPEFR